MLLSDRYDDRTHFIYEILQNAEDALSRRQDPDGPRSVNFSLSKDSLQVSHHGKLFTESDVRGICGIGKSTKSEKFTEIGRFGIGFKSVYAFTDAPEVYSGEEHFAIDSFVWPREISPTDTGQGETVFVIPFRRDDPSAYNDIASGLRKLGVRTLLFLREIEEISWTVEGGPSGLYLRSKPETLAENARRIVLIGQEGEKEVDETWLLFSREVKTGEDTHAGYVEIAFALDKDANNSLTVRRANNSPLMVFFPTIVSTNLGFLIQGPYRTTPSRDNVPRNDEWNRQLVIETASLLVEALRSLREMDLLSIEALRALPIDRVKFGEGSMFVPLFDEIKAALASEDLLPRFSGGYGPGSQAKLARTKELRELLNPSQLALLYGASQEIYWLSEDITLNRTPELRQYLMNELQISEVEPEAFLSKISESFLEAQSDSWMAQLYEFLLGQPSLWRFGGFRDKPIIRIEGEGIPRHVVPFIQGQPQAFLPGSTASDFPVVRRVICSHPPAVEFLKQLGLSVPDPVDDVVVNLIPRYRDITIAVTDEEYAKDIARILDAFATDSKSQKEKLLQALRGSKFVRAVDAGTGEKQFVTPESAYRTTQRIKTVFNGIGDVLLTDDSTGALRGEAVRDLLQACGCLDVLRTRACDDSLTWEEKEELRIMRGNNTYTWHQVNKEADCPELGVLVETFATLTPAEAQSKASELWKLLCETLRDRREAYFYAEYSWSYYKNSWRCVFPAYWVRRLRGAKWVPHQDGSLQCPSEICFSDTTQELHEDAPHFLIEILGFRPEAIKELAAKEGIDLDALNLFKQHGLTADKLRQLLGEAPTGEKSLSPEGAIKSLLGSDHPEPTPGTPDDSDELRGSAQGGGSRSNAGGGTGSVGSGGLQTGHAGSGGGSGQGAKTGHTGGGYKRTPGSAGGRPFISYIGSHPEQEERDPDGLSQQERSDLENKAISLILSGEAQLKRTPLNNPGAFKSSFV